MEPTFDSQADNGAVKKRYLCLTILAMRRPGTSHEDMRNHMTQISAPMTKGLMVKYGVKRWTQIHNTEATRALTTQLFDRQLPNVAAWDCFSQCVFSDIAGYKAMKEDPWYKEHLIGDHEKFADTQRTELTIGWIEEWVRDGRVCNGLEFTEDPPERERKLSAQHQDGHHAQTSRVQYVGYILGVLGVGAVAYTKLLRQARL